jgi:hypothetical protein
MRGALVVALLLMAAPLAAQTTGLAQQAADDDEERTPYSRWHLGVLSGAQQVERTGVSGGPEFGVRLRKYVHLVVEGGRMSDVVTGSRINEIDGYANFVQDSRGIPVTGHIDGRAWFAMAGIRLIPDGQPAGQSSGVRPYLIATAGLARVEYKPAFTVDGQAVSGAGIVTYGVTLGRDLLGTTNKFAYTGGAGIVFGDTWYLDLGVRVTRMQTTDHPTTVKRLVIGMGRRF